MCADIANAGPERRWPRSHAAPDTVERAVRICAALGIEDQLTLAGEQATVAAFTGSLADATEVLADDGLLVLTFSGHTVRGDGPIETARWCLFDGGVELSQIAGQLARFPGDARVIVIRDSCDAAAIARTLTGSQPVLLLASCSEDQTMIDRLQSEFVVRLEDLVTSHPARGTLAELREALEADTPDCERPVVWSNAEERWPRTMSAWERSRRHGRRPSQAPTLALPISACSPEDRDEEKTPTRAAGAQRSHQLVRRCACSRVRRSATPLSSAHRAGNAPVMS